MTGDIAPLRRTAALLPALGALVLATAFLTGCGMTDDTPPAGSGAAEGSGDEASEQSPEPETIAPAGLEEVDFGNLAWSFMLGGHQSERTMLDMVDGTAMDGPMEFTVGEVVLSELNGDDRIDAAVAISRADGNGFEEQWYLWIATDDGPHQVPMPIAHMSRCGTAIHSVTAADGGGVVVH
ncbi:hypothetical protein, partial [Leucobacter sp.]